MKKIIPILLFSICLNHLNIAGTLETFSYRINKENTRTAQNFPADEESESEKENKGKANIEEQEKFFIRDKHNSLYPFQSIQPVIFYCINADITLCPFQEDDTKPPQIN